MPSLPLLLLLPACFPSWSLPSLWSIKYPMKWCNPVSLKGFGTWRLASLELCNGETLELWKFPKFCSSRIFLNRAILQFLPRPGGFDATRVNNPEGEQKNWPIKKVLGKTLLSKGKHEVHALRMSKAKQILSGSTVSETSTPAQTSEISAGNKSRNAGHTKHTSVYWASWALPESRYFTQESDPQQN